MAISLSIWGLSQTSNSNGFSKPQNAQETTQAQVHQQNEANEFQKDMNRIAILTESRDMERLLQFSADLEKKWAKNIVAHSRLLAEISNSLSTYDFRDSRQYIYSVAFAKRVLKNSDDLDAQLEYEMISKLQSTSAYFSGVEPQEKWQSDRAERIRLILHLWNRVRNNIERSFDTEDIKNRPMGNIPVPGPYTAGIRPEDIKEPDIRVRYIEAIAANKSKAERYNLQVQLQKLDKVLPQFVERVFVEFYSLEPNKIKELEANMRLFGLATETRQRILDSVKQRFETQK